MRTVVNEMIKDYDLKKWNCDFMGYTFDTIKDLSFHHLIIPKRDSKKNGIGEGYVSWNGAILNRDTSHPYLHTIERIDRNLFLKITQEMVEENINKKLTKENLENIRDMLLWFESKYEDTITSHEKLIVKPEFKTKRLVLSIDEEWNWKNKKYKL